MIKNYEFLPFSIDAICLFISNFTSCGQRKKADKLYKWLYITLGGKKDGRKRKIIKTVRAN